MIHAGVSELRQVFHAHLQVAHGCNGFSYHLLLFYAVECGLKGIWLTRQNLQRTDQIGDDTLLSQDGHNLLRWIKELRLPARLAGSPPHFRLASGGAHWDIGNAHQAWRYGTRMHNGDEQALVAWLYSLCTWVREEMRR